MKNLIATSLVVGLAAGTLAAPTLAKAEEINVVLFVVLFGMPYTQGLQALAGDFEAETGIKANIEVIGQDVFENRITLSFTGATGDIDVVHTPVIQVQRWVAADWLKPITAEVDAMPVKDDILAGPLDAYLINGERWAVPFMAGTGLMTYRKDVLDAAGLDVPDTWEEMLEVAANVHNDETAAIAMRAVPGQGFNMFIFPMVMRAYGGKFFEDYTNGDLTPAINSPENLEALNIYIKLLNDYAPEALPRSMRPHRTVRSCSPWKVPAWSARSWTRKRASSPVKQAWRYLQVVQRDDPLRSPSMALAFRRLLQTPKLQPSSSNGPLAQKR